MPIVIAFGASSCVVTSLLLTNKAFYIRVLSHGNDFFPSDGFLRDMLLSGEYESYLEICPVFLYRLRCWIRR